MLFAKDRQSLNYLSDSALLTTVWHTAIYGKLVKNARVNSVIRVEGESTRQNLHSANGTSLTTHRSVI